MNQKLNRIATLLLTVALLSMLAVPFLSVGTIKADGENWLEGWSYRKSHVINNSTGAGTNYQINITTHYGSGSDSGADVYLNSHSRTDFGDVRFTDDDGQTLLDYWIESKTNSDHAKCWVEVADSLSTAAATIYVYYGKADATNAGNGDNTFVFFDDFPNTSVNTTKWTVVEGVGTITVANSMVNFTKTSTNGQWPYINSTALVALNYEFKARFSSDSLSTGAQSGFSLKNPLSGNAKRSYWLSYVNDVEDIYYNAAVDETNDYVANTCTWATETWYILSHKFNGVGNYWSRDVGSITASYTTKQFAAGTELFIILNAFDSGNTGTQTMKNYFDWVFVKKWVATEPSHGSWGSEEMYGAPSYSDISVSTNAAGAEASFNCKWTIVGATLSGFIFSTNNTGLYENDTWTELSGSSAWANVTKTLNGTIGNIVQYRWYCNSSNNDWGDTGWLNLLLAEYPPTPPTYTLDTYPELVLRNTAFTFSCLWQDNIGLSGYIFSTNNTANGAWANDTWVPFSGNPAWANVTKTLNSTMDMRIQFKWYANDTLNNWNSTSIQSVLTTSFQYWVKQGIVMSPTGWEGSVLCEPTVIYDQGIFKMWYRGSSYGNCAIGYANSTDGITWTKYEGNPVITAGLYGYAAPSIYKIGTNNYLLYVGVPNHPSHGCIDVFASTNGITWTLLAHDIVAKQDWEKGQANPFVWKDNATSLWYMVYQGLNQAGTSWDTGLARSEDGITWTPDATNPIITNAGIRYVFLDPNTHTYYGWYHYCPIPSDIYFVNSTNLLSWTNYVGNPVVERSRYEEGYQLSYAQVADPSIVTVSGRMYMFYDSIRTQSSTSYFCMAYTDIVLTSEIPPTYSNVGTNTTIAGQPCLFYTKWTDETALSGFIFGTNNTGSWQNETWTAFSANPDWSNKTKTLTSTVGVRVEWRIWANDTNNNWNSTTVQSFVTTTEYVSVTINYPQNTIYVTGSIPVQISASGGTIDKIWFNCKNGSDWVYVSNQTYTSPTSMTGFVNGTYTFYAWANNTYGNSDEKTVAFTVAIPPIPEVTVTIFYPQATEYPSGTIPIEIIASGGTISKIWYNFKSGANWVYATNQTYTTPTSKSGFVNGTYTFYAWANNTVGNSDEKTVVFTVAIPEEPTPTPTPSPSPSPSPTPPPTFPATPPFIIPWMVSPLLFIIFTIGGFGIIAYLFTSIKKLSEGVKAFVYIIITVLAMILGWFIALALWSL